MTDPLVDIAATPCHNPRCDTLTQRAYCDPCEYDIHHALQQLPHMYDQLVHIPPRTPHALNGRTLIGPAEQAGLLVERRSHGPIAGRLPKRGEAQRVSGTRDAPLPPGAGNMLTASELHGLTLEWEDLLRAQQELPERPARGRQHITMHESSAWLLRRIITLLDGPDAADFGLAILAAHRRAELTLRLDRLVHHLPVPCGQCEQRTLIRRDGESLIRCGTCDATYPDADWFAQVEAEDMPASPTRQRHRPPRTNADGTPRTNADGTDTRIGVAADLLGYLEETHPKESA